MPPKKPTTKPAAKKPAAPAAKGGAKPAAKPAAAAAPAKPKPEPLPEVEIGLKEINVAITDSEGKVKASGRWPLLIDEAERVPVFIRHRDFNNLNAIDPNDMQPEKIRLGLLGAMRYNKPFTMNLGESGSLDIIVDRFNEVLPGLLDMVLDKSILQEEK
nr:hypothetical protein BaRGS_022629 [Batillaria attramentaria]